jgi:hypothetical protein
MVELFCLFWSKLKCLRDEFSEIQKLISPIKRYIIPYLFTPSLFSFGALQTDWLMDTILHPLFPKSFFFTERPGPYPQAQLYWAGRTVGWMANWTSQDLAKYRGPTYAGIESPASAPLISPIWRANFLKLSSGTQWWKCRNGQSFSIGHPPHTLASCSCGYSFMPYLFVCW